jgi:ABC-2 type transport system ATP-binding protein
VTHDVLEHPPLELQDCEARYASQQVFSGVSLTLQRGEIFGLIGLNGVGKTTLIKSLLDLGPLRSGQIRIFGQPHWAANSRAQLAYLPDRFQPSGALRGVEFLKLALGHFGLPLDRDGASACCQSLGLDPQVLQQSIRTYSKGMGQKLALAATFLTQRPLVILDEPMSGLDPLARVQLKRVLLTHRSQGHTIFFSSHVLSDIEEICDRVGVFHGGDMRFIGTPAELVHRHGSATLEHAFLASIGIQPQEYLS